MKQFRTKTVSIAQYKTLEDTTACRYVETIAFRLLIQKQQEILQISRILRRPLSTLRTVTQEQ